jgi:hypothetical protein
VKSEALIQPQSGVCLRHPKCDRLAGSRCLLDQAFDHVGTNALPPQSAVYGQLGEEQFVAFHEALQPTDIRPIKCNDPNLRRFVPPQMAQENHTSGRKTARLPVKN